jgi:hypothetical protein
VHWEDRGISQRCHRLAGEAKQENTELQYGVISIEAGKQGCGTAEAGVWNCGRKEEKDLRQMELSAKA